ncbi:DUF5606 family protein [Daejeonella lutea]|uniref:Uncharacterized protein n=1 Tax=Daejeonella lutea TaxID=572036 RepID=A0A1T5C1G1_9SPHI|nr:DUF5606 domain-containing protein [Daejeonella lutea]SKB53458.1 hypothetical protein SAMN05661099_1758 [Daejeonella lutea]
MNLRGLVSVSGKPGLFKLIGQNKSGFILETLDEQKNKIVVNISTAKMASLEDITVFGESGDLKLSDIFEQIKASKNIPDPKSADGKTLREFFSDVAPDHDEERVYSSDIKKIISWYNTISVLPLFTEAAPEPLAEGAGAPALSEAVKKPEPVAKEKPKATKAAGKSTTRLSQKSK